MVIVRVCVGCRCRFEIDEREQEWLQRKARDLGWHEAGLPRRCTDCRKAKRERPNIVPPDTVIQWYEIDCEGCRQTFRVGPRDVEYLIANRFPWPRRCRICRFQRRQQPEHFIFCRGCGARVRLDEADMTRNGMRCPECVGAARSVGV